MGNDIQSAYARATAQQKANMPTASFKLLAAAQLARMDHLCHMAIEKNALLTEILGGEPISINAPMRRKRQIGALIGGVLGGLGLLLGGYNTMELAKISSDVA